MSKVNFVSEFNSIMRYARDYSLSLRERILISEFCQNGASKKIK